MPQNLETVLRNVEEVSNDITRQIIQEYHKHLVVRDKYKLSEG